MNGNEMPAPQPVPDLTPATPVPGVTDEDRNRYGVLLDHAAERGLLSPAAYQVGLVELAEATTVEQLRRIVTELPAFGGAVPAAAAAAASPGTTSVPGRTPGRTSDPAVLPGRSTPELDAALWASLTPASSRKGQVNPFIILAVVVAILLVGMVGLALVAAHVVHTHTGATTGTGMAGLSLLRP
jgi:hypothetical protein